MGSSCSSSAHRIQEPNIMNLPPSPVEAKPKNGNFDIALKSQSTITFTPYASNSGRVPVLAGFEGSKEESFFDSKAWFDSDCEDDFYSVNGEFTPSCGSTPVHHTFGTPIVNKNPSESMIPGSVPELSPPTKKKKSLLELFRESVRERQGGDDIKKSLGGNEKKQVKPIIHDLLPKSRSSERTTYIISRTNSARSSERTMNVDHANSRAKSVKSVQGCLTSLASCRSFSERRRKTYKSYSSS